MLARPSEYLEIEVVVDKPKKSSWWWRWSLYIIYPLCGVVLLLIALLMSLTVIGFFLAIPMFAGALGGLAYPFTFKYNHYKFQKVNCPKCHHRKRILPKAPAYTCVKCRARIGINWIE